jgi:hypothetical protein
MKHFPCEMFAMFLVVEQFLVFRVFAQVLARDGQESARATSRVADDVSQSRLDHLDHHLDDVPGRAELAVDARRRQLTLTLHIF